MASMQKNDLEKKYNLLSKVLIRLPALIVTGISWYISSRQTFPTPGFDNSDKVIHFICFGGLAFCWTFWFSSSRWIQKTMVCSACVFLITGLYGMTDEIHQSFVPGRDCSFFDWLADSAGTICAIAFRIFLIRKISEKKKEA